MSGETEGGEKPPGESAPETPDELAKARQELADARRKLKELDDASKKAERAKLSEQEQLQASLKELQEQLAASNGELGSLKRDLRFGKQRDEVAKLRPDLGLDLLEAVLRGLGDDAAPEEVTPTSTKKLVEKLNKLSPPPQKSTPGIPPPGLPPRDGGPIDYRARGALVANRGKAQRRKPAPERKPATATTRKKRR